MIAGALGRRRSFFGLLFISGTNNQRYTHLSTAGIDVQWLETKRKRKLESHEVFSEDPALYRWQCWASTHQDPNAKDPTFVEDPRFRTSDAKVGCVMVHLRFLNAEGMYSAGPSAS